MNEGDSLIEYLNALNNVINQLLFIGIKITKEEKCISLLCSLLDSWDSLVMVIGGNNTTLKIDDVVACVVSEN